MCLRSSHRTTISQYTTLRMESGISLSTTFPLDIADQRKIVLGHSVPLVERKSNIDRCVIKIVFTTAISSQAAILSINPKLLIGMLMLPIKYHMVSNTTSTHSSTGICMTVEATHKTTSGINHMAICKTTGLQMVSTFLIRQSIKSGWWDLIQLSKTWRLTTSTWHLILISTMAKARRMVKILKSLMEKKRKTSWRLIPMSTWSWAPKLLLINTQLGIGNLLPLMRRLSREHWKLESSKWSLLTSPRCLRKQINK